MENFVRVARAGSLTKVARDLDVTPSALSKQISQLERELQAALMVRGRNQDLTLTPAGRVYFDGVVPLLEGLKEVEREVAGLTERGVLLRIRAPQLLARAFLAPGLKEFSRKHPQVTIHHVSAGGNESVDVDVFIYAPEWSEGDEADRSPESVLHTLGTQSWVALAAADSALGAAKTPRAIRNVCALHLGQPLNEWIFVNGSLTVEKRFHLQAVGDDHEVLAAYIEDRRAVALLPTWAACNLLQSGKYRRILDEWTISPAKGAGDVVIRMSSAVEGTPEAEDFIAFMERRLRYVANES